VTQEDRPSDATGAAALQAGWYHGHRDVSGGWLRPAAARMAAAVSADPGTALRIHTREELGVDPDELPSPVVAGVASLLAFSCGALVPLFPYLAGLHVLWASLGLTAIALASGGMVVGRLTGRPVLRSGLRQLALGGLAIAVTYLVGHLIGSHGT
jgi:vacuolar iron transporter family protein